jgi:hypothetical protein
MLDHVLKGSAIKSVENNSTQNFVIDMH